MIKKTLKNKMIIDKIYKNVNNLLYLFIYIFIVRYLNIIKFDHNLIFKGSYY